MPIGKLAARISVACTKATSIAGDKYIFFILFQDLFTIDDIQALRGFLHAAAREVVDDRSSLFLLLDGKIRLVGVPKVTAYTPAVTALAGRYALPAASAAALVAS